jgi:hypothetical protein
LRLSACKTIVLLCFFLLTLIISQILSEKVETRFGYLRISHYFAFTSQTSHYTVKSRLLQLQKVTKTKLSPYLPCLVQDISLKKNTTKRSPKLRLDTIKTVRLPPRLLNLIQKLIIHLNIHNLSLPIYCGGTFHTGHKRFSQTNRNAANIQSLALNVPFKLLPLIVFLQGGRLKITYQLLWLFNRNLCHDGSALLNDLKTFRWTIKYFLPALPSHYACSYSLFSQRGHSTDRATTPTLLEAMISHLLPHPKQYMTWPSVFKKRTSFQLLSPKWKKKKRGKRAIPPRLKKYKFMPGHPYLPGYHITNALR